ncbi:hypothetical protein SEA_JUANYO_53 [Microbacterium phage Juanyo]|nr:hypothetical protein SEA_JUANYO_53 [Microbacterium phage Juanyo]
MFVIARTRAGRPSLQHLMAEGSWDATACGLPVGGWSAAWQHDPIPEVLCKKCEKKLRKG